MLLATARASARGPVLTWSRHQCSSAALCHDGRSFHPPRAIAPGTLLHPTSLLLPWGSVCSQACPHIDPPPGQILGFWGVPRHQHPPRWLSLSQPFESSSLGVRASPSEHWSLPLPAPPALSSCPASVSHGDKSLAQLLTSGSLAGSIQYVVWPWKDKGVLRGLGPAIHLLWACPGLPCVHSHSG